MDTQNVQASTPENQHATQQTYSQNDTATAEGVSLNSQGAAVADKSTHVFKKPYAFEDETFASIKLDLDGLTGNEIQTAAKQYQAKGNFAVLPAYDIGFCATLAAIAAKKPKQFIDGLPAGEFLAVTQKVTHFLTATA